MQEKRVAYSLFVGPLLLPMLSILFRILLTYVIANTKENMQVMIDFLRSYFFYVMLITLLPGCGKVVDWVKDSLPQASLVELRCNQAESYVKSVVVYDQLSTVAKFDALWLSDEVRSLYVDIMGLKFGKNDDQKEIILRRQLEENNQSISFYVLSLYEYPLGDYLSVWTMFLSIDGKNYSPKEIKPVELSPEYGCMFGKRLNRFKVVYQVSFEAKDIDGISLISSDVKSINLIFRSIKNVVVLQWDLSK